MRPESVWLVASSVGKFPLALSARCRAAVRSSTRPRSSSRPSRGPRSGWSVTPTARHDRGRPVAPASARWRTRKANDRTPDPVRWQLEPPRRSSRSTGRRRSPASPRAARPSPPPVRGASASLDVRVVPSTGIAQLTLTPAAAHRAPGRRGALRGRGARRRRPVRWRASRPRWSFAPGDGQLDADGRFVAYRPGRVHGHRLARPARRDSTTVTVARARRAAVGDGRRPAAAHRVRDLAKSGSTPTARWPTSAPTRAATGSTPSTSPTPASRWWSIRSWRTPAS